MTLRKVEIENNSFLVRTWDEEQNDFEQQPIFVVTNNEENGDWSGRAITNAAELALISVQHMDPLILAEDLVLWTNRTLDPKNESHLYLQLTNDLLVKVEGKWYITGYHCQLDNLTSVSDSQRFKLDRTKQVTDSDGTRYQILDFRGGRLL